MFIYVIYGYLWQSTDYLMLFLIATSAVGFMISAAFSGSKPLGYSKDFYMTAPTVDSRDCSSWMWVKMEDLGDHRC